MKDFIDGDLVNEIRARVTDHLSRHRRGTNHTNRKFSKNGEGRRGRTRLNFRQIVQLIIEVFTPQ